jgi:hypothetical protein
MCERVVDSGHRREEGTRCCCPKHRPARQQNDPRKLAATYPEPMSPDNLDIAILKLKTITGMVRTAMAR